MIIQREKGGTIAIAKVSAEQEPHHQGLASWGACVQELGREGSQACWGWEGTMCPPQCVLHGMSPMAMSPQCIPQVSPMVLPEAPGYRCWQTSSPGLPRRRRSPAPLLPLLPPHPSSTCTSGAHSVSPRLLGCFGQVPPKARFCTGATTCMCLSGRWGPGLASSSAHGGSSC